MSLYPHYFLTHTNNFYFNFFYPSPSKITNSSFSTSSSPCPLGLRPSPPSPRTHASIFSSITSHRHQEQPQQHEQLCHPAHYTDTEFTPRTRRRRTTGEKVNSWRLFEHTKKKKKKKLIWVRQISYFLHICDPSLFMIYILDAHPYVPIYLENV